MLFQFTPLREGRQSANVSVQVINQFQFTPLREGRQPRNRQARCSAHFNSRSSARGDLSEYRVRRILIISIHAPPRGATCRFQNSREAHIFQFTPLREGRHISRVRRDAEDLFQFTPLREGRQSVYYKVLEDYIFQFTPLREGRRAMAGRSCAKPHFNSRPSARGD